MITGPRSRLQRYRHLDANRISGSDQPKIESGLPRWSTILSPNMGPTNGRGLEDVDGIA